MTVIFTSSVAQAMTCAAILKSHVVVKRLDAYRGDVIEFGAIFLVSEEGKQTVYKSTQSSKFEKESLELGAFIVQETKSELIAVEVPIELTEAPEVLRGRLSLNESVDTILKSNFTPNVLDHDPNNPIEAIEVAQKYHKEAMRIHNWVKEKSPMFRGYPVETRTDNGLPDLFEGGSEYLADNFAAIEAHRRGGYVFDFFYFKAGPYRFRINYEYGSADLMNQHFDGQRYVLFDPL